MKYKYYLDVQTDPAWANDAMALPGEILGNHGCLVTALSNTKVLQCIPYTPKTLNAELRAGKGYVFLRDQATKENQSFVCWESDEKGKGVCEILGCSVNHNVKLSVDRIDGLIKTGRTFFIARVIVNYRNSKGALATIGHYINILYVLDSKYICFDTYDGRVNVLEEKDITLKLQINYF